MFFGEEKKLKLISLAISGIFLVISGCVTETDLNNVRYELISQQNKLAFENKKLKQELASLQTQLSATKNQLRLQLEKTANPVRSAQANLWAEIQKLQVQLANLTGQIQELQRQQANLSQNDQEIKQKLKTLETQTKTLSGQLTVLASRLGIPLANGNFTAEFNSPKNSTPSQTLAKTPEELYKQALSAFYDHKYDLAQALWQQFVQNYPKHKLVANAYFWQGECFYQQEEYKRAILAYQKVIEKYPKSNKVKTAIFKQALAFIKIKKKKPAIILLKKVILRFPKSIEAKRAKIILGNLEGKK